MTLRQQLAKLFTDSHTPWPEMKPIEWPNTFADKAMKLVDQYGQEIAREARLDEIENLFGDKINVMNYFEIDSELILNRKAELTQKPPQPDKTKS